MDDDDTQEQTQPEQLDPIDAYNRARSAFGVELDDLNRAIADADVELFAISAGDAVTIWLTADAALNRFAHALIESPALLDVARLGLSERFDALLELFDLASARFATPGLRDRLANLRMALEIARR